MTQYAFFRYFSIVSATSAGLLILLNQFALFKPYLLFSFASLILFMALTLGMFYLGSKAARSSNKNLFTSMVLGFTFGKIFLSLILVLTYYYLGNPSSKIFLIPFFLIYLIFTIFETYFMMQIGQHSKPISVPKH